jgi:hypothetical protein
MVEEERRLRNRAVTMGPPAIASRSRSRLTLS